MENKLLAIVVISALAAPLLSLDISMIARALFLRNAPEPAREHLKAIEDTAKRVAALRKANRVSQREMEEVLKKVVTISLTEDRGERLLLELRNVRVDGDPKKKEVLIKSAERSLRTRFSAPAHVPTQL